MTEHFLGNNAESSLNIEKKKENEPIQGEIFLLFFNILATKKIRLRDHFMSCYIIEGIFYL